MKNSTREWKYEVVSLIRRHIWSQKLLLRWTHFSWKYSSISTVKHFYMLSCLFKFRTDINDRCLFRKHQTRFWQQFLSRFCLFYEHFSPILLILCREWTFQNGYVSFCTFLINKSGSVAHRYAELYELNHEKNRSCASHIFTLKIAIFQKCMI